MKPVCKSARKTSSSNHAAWRTRFAAPLTLALLYGFTVLPEARSAATTPEPALVVILPADKRLSDQMAAAMVALKDALRGDPRLEVLTYSADAPSFIIAARSASLDIKKLSNDDQRQALARALGAKVWVKIGLDKRDESSIELSVFDAADGHALNDTAEPADLTIPQAAALVTTDALPPPTTAPTTAPPPPLTMPPTISSPAQPVIQSPAATAVSAPVPPALSLTTSAPPAPLVQPAPAPVTSPSPVPLPAAPHPPLSTLPPSAVQQPPAVLPPVSATPVRPAPLASAPAAVLATPAPLPIVAPATRPVQVLTTPLPTSAQQPVLSTPAPAQAQALPPAAPPRVPAAAPALPEPAVAFASSGKPPTPLDLTTQSFLDQGDAAMARGDDSGAVDAYRSAINESPLNAAPRVRLAQAYLASGDAKAAIGELSRAVAVDPKNAELNTYLQQARDQHLLAGAALLLLSVNAASKPSDAQTQLALGDAYWNGNNIDLAEKTYLQAAHDAADPSQAALAYAHLARLYAATQHYSECLKALSLSSGQGYSVALKIIQQQSDNLIGSIDSSVQQFNSGAITRTQLYDQLRTLDGEVSAFAAFIGKITPPSEYKVSFLHRKLAANLMAQMTPDLLNYALTAQSNYLAQSQFLQHDALDELKQADAIDHA